MKGGMSSFIEASLRTLGDVGKMGGLEAVAVVAPGLTEAVVVNAGVVVLIGGDTCLRLSVDSVFVPELDSPP